jgi:hypothetical protein
VCVCEREREREQGACASSKVEDKVEYKVGVAAESVAGGVYSERVRERARACA